MATNNAINANSTTPLPIVDGGTGVIAVTTAPTATAFAGWDTNSNLSANNHIQGYATTATAAATTTLTVASAYYQFFTGSTTQTVKMPVTSTLVNGQSWYIVNNSTGIVTVQSSGSNTITALNGGSAAIFTCISTSGTTAASWNSSFSEFEVPITVAQGGTGNTSATAYALLAGGTTSTGAFQSLSTGTSGYVLTSGGSAALPTYTNTPTLSSITFSPTTNGIVGTTTNDSASATYVGQVISSQVTSGSPVALSNGIVSNITSISLTAGDWQVWGNVAFVGSGPVITSVTGSISTTSATNADLSLAYFLTIAAFSNAGGSCASVRASLSGTTTYYLCGGAAFASGSVNASGLIIARRMR